MTSDFPPVPDGYRVGEGYRTHGWPIGWIIRHKASNKAIWTGDEPFNECIAALVSSVENNTPVPPGPPPFTQKTMSEAWWNSWSAKQAST